MMGVPGVPGDLSLGPVIWEDCEQAGILQMDWSIQIPFATFLFGSHVLGLLLSPASLEQ